MLYVFPCLCLYQKYSYVTNQTSKSFTTENDFSIEDFANAKDPSRARVPKAGRNNGDMQSHRLLPISALPSTDLRCSASLVLRHFCTESGYAQ